MTKTTPRPEVQADEYATPAHRAAAQLCTELTAGLVRPPAAPPASGFRAWLRQTLAADPGVEVERHRAELAGSKPRPLAVLRFARFLQQSGYAELAVVAWSLLHRLCPHDPVPSAALAEAFLARARRPERGFAERLHDYDRFFRYAGRALAALPADHPVARWKTAAACEVTILKGQYDNP